MTETKFDLAAFLADPFAGTGLPKRTREIGLLSAKGMTAAEIAAEIGCHHMTANRHLEILVSRLQLDKPRQLSAWVFEMIEEGAKNETV